MLFAKTIILAILGFGATAFAAPVETAETTAAVQALDQAVQDLCDRIPPDERHRHRECERDLRHGDRYDACRDIPHRDRPRWC